MRKVGSETQEEVQSEVVELAFLLPRVLLLMPWGRKREKERESVRGNVQGKKENK